MGAWPRSRAWRTLNCSAPEGPTLNRSLDVLERAVLHPKKSVTTAADGGDCGGAVSALVQAASGLGLPTTDESLRPCRRAEPGRAGLGGSLFQSGGGERLVRTGPLECGHDPGGGLRRTRAPQRRAGPARSPSD
ncbi:hypothetical protein NDU88_000592 [Pleurodeles waltl]|uniref:Uncharacterized protein n=1 Tax=Pleurodeles waltl TaxID=8319 RepID=A0AAV7WLU0_PLEWA|nr:hypothetical protein NDU88_000592 [Pleurodeles waltl]